MKHFRNIFKDRAEISVRYDEEDKAVWLYLNPKERPILSRKMIKSGLKMQKAIITYFQKSSVLKKYPIHFVVVASQTKDIFNYGGDLNYFIELIEQKNRDELYKY